MANILTSIEIVISAIIAIMIFFPGGVLPDVIIWLFVVGELCDAFDGICARRWHYPDDGKKRWWRGCASIIDQISDIMLIVTTALYLIISRAKISLLILGAAIGFFCILVEIWKRFHYSERLVLFRRYIYLGAIAITLFELLFATSWSDTAKYLAVIAIFIVGIALMIFDRSLVGADKFADLG